MSDLEQRAASKFAAYSTGIAFNITLSKQMIMLLWFIGDGKCDYNLYQVHRGLRDGIASGRSLLHRGLVWSPDPEWPGRYEITEAGQHVLSLLRLAGLLETMPKIEKAA